MWNVKEKNDRILRIVLYILFACLTFYMMYQLPYCHDEWKWGLPGRLRLMKKGFADYNGRYLGNLLALCVTRSNLLKAIVMSGTLLYLLFLVERLLPKTKSSAEGRMIMLAAVFGILALPKELFAQSYGWCAAFVNFVPPIVLLLAYLSATHKLWNGEAYEDRIGKAIGIFFLAFAAQLFSEHNTLLNLFVAVSLLVYSRIKDKKTYRVQVAWLGGCVAGACLMFSNGSYRNAAEHTRGYKSIVFSFRSFYFQFRDQICPFLFLNNWIVNLGITLSLLVLLGKREKRDRLLNMAVAYMCVYSAYSGWHRLNPSWKVFLDTGKNNTLMAAMSILFFFSTLVAIWKLSQKKERFQRVMLYFLSAVSAVPLLAADPIGARCFYTAYLLQLVVCLQLIAVCLRDREKEEIEKGALLGMALILAMLAGIYINMFYKIGVVRQEREVRIEQAVALGSQEVILPYYPYSGYIWTTEPQDEAGKKYFRKFYGIPEEMEIRFE